MSNDERAVKQTLAAILWPSFPVAGGANAEHTKAKR